MVIEFGDRVKFTDSEITKIAGVSGKEGVCMGYTTPSSTNIKFIGDQSIDYAILIELSENAQNIWTTEDLVEFINYNEGLEFEIVNTRAKRRVDGTWHNELIDSTKEKQNWFKKIFRRK